MSDILNEPIEHVPALPFLWGMIYGLFAGSIFISSFRDAGFRAEAFGSKLLGSLVGGRVGCVSYRIEIQARVLVAALFYLLSLVTLNRGSLQAEPR